MYNYIYKVEVMKVERDDFREFLFSHYGMKPKINYRDNEATVLCYGYSLEEKSKNKKMLFEAITAFRQYVFDKDTNKMA